MNPDPTSLDRLNDIVAPPAIPWWPPAPAWYWVLATLAVLTAVGVVRLLLHWLHNYYRREALSALVQNETALADPSQRARAVAEIAVLVKRTALTAFPRETVASLTGPAWLAFLDRTGHTTGFASGPGQWLDRAAFEPAAATSLDEAQTRALISLVRHWLAHHRVENVTSAC